MVDALGLVRFEREAGRRGAEVPHLDRSVETCAGKFSQVFSPLRLYGLAHLANVFVSLGLTDGC